NGCRFRPSLVRHIPLMLNGAFIRREIEMPPRPLIAGNWKMNGLLASLEELRKIAALPAVCDVLVCPPATLIAPAAEVLKGSAVALGGQDCHARASGAHTGDVSA